MFSLLFSHRNVSFVRRNAPAERQVANLEELESDVRARDSRGRTEKQEAIFFEVNSLYLI